MRRTVLALVTIFVIAACSGSKSQPADQPTEQAAGSGVAPVEQPGTEPSPGTEDPTNAESPSECVATCQRDNAMKAVSAEQIEADCKANCCVSDCVARNQMKAVSAEQIEKDCQSDCGGW